MKKCISILAAVLMVLGICLGGGRLGREHGSLDCCFGRPEDEAETVDWDAEHFASSSKPAAATSVSFLETLDLIACSSERTTKTRLAAEATVSPAKMPPCPEPAAPVPDWMPYVND